jgi:hypothetical protein
MEDGSKTTSFSRYHRYLVASLSVLTEEAQLQVSAIASALATSIALFVAITKDSSDTLLCLAIICHS